MILNAAAVPPTCATLDQEGRLVAADPWLRELNDRAGGSVGQTLAVPHLGRIARLAMRLGIEVSRTIVVADGGDDLDLRVRAVPVAAHAGMDGVALTVTDWFRRPSWQPDGTAEGNAGDFLRSAADWMWETDSTLALTSLAASETMPHAVDAALLGLPLTRMFLLGEDDAGTFPILTGLAQRRPFEDQRATLRSTGQPVLLSAAPRVDSAGAFVGFIGAAHTLDSPVQHAAKPAAPLTSDLDAVATAFAARLDQTLRAPLDRIITNADSIHAQSNGPLKPDYAEYAADIASAGRHLIGLVDDLVDLQAIERTDFSVAREPIDLTDVARRAAGLLQIRAAAARVRIDKPAFGETLPVTGEFKRALQVLVNLVANAVRYSPIDGMVWIRAERAGPVAAIIVADQGKGIAPADQERIFGKFERVDKNEAGGSGLGLYIARRLARAMGGDVTVDSAPGQGARFVFTLPLTE